MVDNPKTQSPRPRWLDAFFLLMVLFSMAGLIYVSGGEATEAP
jgi:hypothetical protein